MISHLRPIATQRSTHNISDFCVASDDSEFHSDANGRAFITNGPKLSGR